MRLCGASMARHRKEGGRVSQRKRLGMSREQQKGGRTQEVIEFDLKFRMVLTLRPPLDAHLVEHLVEEG